MLGDLTSWLFQEKSVLRVVATHHSRVKSAPTDERADYEETGDGNKMYRIKDRVVSLESVPAFAFPSHSPLPLASSADHGMLCDAC